MKNTWTDVQMQRKIEELEAQNASQAALINQLTKEVESLLGKLMRCPKCGTLGEHYCPADVARE